MNKLLEILSAIVGSHHVLTGLDLDDYEQDWRRRVRGKALCVVRPSSTQEVALVVKACAAVGASIVPQGGNTGLVGGLDPGRFRHSGSHEFAKDDRCTSYRS